MFVSDTHIPRSTFRSSTITCFELNQNNRFYGLAFFTLLRINNIRPHSNLKLASFNVLDFLVLFAECNIPWSCFLTQLHISFLEDHKKI